MSHLIMKILISVVLATCLVVISAKAQEINVEYPDWGQKQSLKLEQPVRLSEVLEKTVFALDSNQQLRLYWPASRLGTDKLQTDLQQQRDAVLRELALLEQYWIKRGRVDIKQAVSFLIHEIEQMTLRASYYFALEPDRVRVQLQSNPLLTRAEGDIFYLRVPSKAPGRRHLGLSEQATGADIEWLWQIAQNGDVKQIPTGLSNRHQNALCYPHRPSSPLSVGEPDLCQPTDRLTQGITFRGIAAPYLPEDWQSINRRIAEIIKHRVE